MAEKKKVIQVREFQTKVLHSVDEEINKFLRERGMTRDMLIDIKYVVSIAGTIVLVVYEEDA